MHENKKCRDACYMRLDLRYWYFAGDTKGYAIGKDMPIYTIRHMAISLVSHISDESVRYYYKLLSKSCYPMETVRNPMQEIIDDNKQGTCSLRAS